MLNPKDGAHAGLLQKIKLTKIQYKNHLKCQWIFCAICHILNMDRMAAAEVIGFFNCFALFTGGEDMYNVMDVARFIVNYSIEIKRPVSNLKLQKLLYYVQAEFVRWFNKPCFDDPIIHWRHGPVVESVYQKYKAYGSDNILDKESKYLSFEFNFPTMEFTPVWKDYNENIFEFQHLSMIKQVIERYKDISPWDMVELTHQEDSWIKTGRNEEITIDMIRQYYL